MIPWTAARQASLSITNSQSLLKLMSVELVSHPTISPSVGPFSSCLQSFPESGSFLVSCSSHQVTKYWSFSFSISPSNEYSVFISFRIFGSPCSPRDSQESPPAPQFKSISSSALSPLYGPTLTSTHDCWKNLLPVSHKDPCL